MDATPKKENFIVETIKFILLALIIVLPIRIFIAEPFVVSGASMDPAFHDGQYLIVDRLSYRFTEPARGDVVIFEPPVDPDKYYIKRLIGLPGETIEIHGTEITVKNAENPNGFKIDDSFVDTVNKKYDELSITLKEGNYFVMGDNRKSSSDSRIWGPIKRDAIVGRPAARLFPIQKVSIYPGKVSFEK
jgi:signal peptidase I